jgi:hypothetical protein
MTLYPRQKKTYQPCTQTTLGIFIAKLTRVHDLGEESNYYEKQSWLRQGSIANTRPWYNLVMALDQFRVNVEESIKQSENQHLVGWRWHPEFTRV